MRKQTKHIAIHCSATPQRMDIGAEEINEWHKERGWSGIGYHFVIRRNANLELGRPMSAVGAHVKGHNSTSIGVCLVGGVNDAGDPEDNFTARQMNTLRILLLGLTAIYPGAVVQGHRDFEGVAKACPSFEVRDWWREHDPRG